MDEVIAERAAESPGFTIQDTITLTLTREEAYAIKHWAKQMIGWDEETDTPAMEKLIAALEPRMSDE